MSLYSRAGQKTVNCSWLLEGPRCRLQCNRSNLEGFLRTVGWHFTSPLGRPGFPLRMPRAYVFFLKKNILIFYVADCLYALRDFLPPRGSGCNSVSPPCRAGRIATSLNAAGAPTRRHRWASMPCGRRILFDQVCRNVAQPYASAS